MRLDRLNDIRKILDDGQEAVSSLAKKHIDEEDFWLCIDAMAIRLADAMCQRTDTEPAVMSVKKVGLN